VKLFFTTGPSNIRFAFFWRRNTESGQKYKQDSGIIFFRDPKGLTCAKQHDIFLKNDMEDELKEFIRVMKALSDPTRVKILKILERRIMCVCELQAAIGAAQSTTSKHLKILEDAGLVGSQKDGLWVNYTLADGRQSPYAASLLGNLRHWLNDEPDVSAIMATIDKIDRLEILNKN
jgi:ArsR family transcriptional regulator